jgi:hypothetical protein
LRQRPPAINADRDQLGHLEQLRNVAVIRHDVTSGRHPMPGPYDPSRTGSSCFIITKIMPILLAVLGVKSISRVGKGEMSRVLTSSAIAIIVFVFIAGAAALLVFGRSLVDPIFPMPPQP